MRAAVTRALAIDDDLAEAHAARALLLAVHEWRLADAEPAFRRALALDPGDATAHSWYTQYLIATGRRDEALAESRRAIELDPLSLVINTGFGSRLYWARRFDEAIAQCRKTLELDPAYGGARRCLALAYAQRGAHEQAVRELERDRFRFYANAVCTSGSRLRIRTRRALKGCAQGHHGTDESILPRIRAPICTGARPRRAWGKRSRIGVAGARRRGTKPAAGLSQRRAGFRRPAR